jgi:hypothetical protein
VSAVRQLGDVARDALHLEYRQHLAGHLLAKPPPKQQLTGPQTPLGPGWPNSNWAVPSAGFLSGYYYQTLIIPPGYSNTTSLETFGIGRGSVMGANVGDRGHNATPDLRVCPLVRACRFRTSSPLSALGGREGYEYTPYAALVVEN